jgi:hypothetical protein
LQRADGELQKLVFHSQQLNQEITKTATPMNQLRTSLTNWANNFGTTMDQVAHTIESTVNTALQSLNTYLVTGKFNAQQLLQSIEMLGLQLIEQLIIQRVMAAINASAATAQAATTGPIIAAAYAPAATAVTVATEGQAALAAPAEYATALLAIQAMAVAHEGGEIRALKKMHSGGLGSDEEMIIAQQGEFMVQRSVAQRPGVMEFLSALNAGAFHGGGVIRRYHSGDDIEPAALDQFTPSLQEIMGGIALHMLGDVSLSSRASRTIEDIQQRSYDYGSGLGRFMDYSFNPPSWTPGFTQGPTLIPSQFDLSGYPIAQSVGWTPTVQQNRLSLDYPSIQPKHRGGMIGVRRAHSGGVMSGGKISSGNVNVLNYTDLKALVKEMSTRKGRNIIIDTVRGQRIDLGMR